MNMHVALLFINAILVTILAAVVVFIILRKEYLPVIKKLEKAEEKSHLNKNSNQKNI